MVKETASLQNWRAADAALKSEFERRQDDVRLTAHDIAVYERMVVDLRTRHYGVGAQEAADAITTLLFDAKRNMEQAQ